MLFMKGMIDLAPISQGLSCKVCYATLSNFFAFVLFIVPVFGTAIIHQQLVAMLRGHMRFLYTKVSEECIKSVGGV